ncbi:MAG: phage tail sheath subtilisin-like domain-containing protein [Methylococcaceae bacterium]|nr:phage tail sheath subtilisin-like domain-containing protein [Methylococcaceae bacterium]
MPVKPSYPGIYIEELPSNSHTIVAAPTSIAVFIGYAHPFKSGFTDTGVITDKVRLDEVFSFTDYERKFGGYFSSGWISPHLPIAVNQFFLNGGTDAYIVGLRPFYQPGSVPGAVAVTPASATGANLITFTARELVDQTPINVTISPNSDGTAADMTISYAQSAETFRSVSLVKFLPSGESNSRYIENVIGTPDNPVSSLVTVPTGGAYPAKFKPNPDKFVISGGVPSGKTSAYNPGDFIAAFQEEGPLDKVPIFNLMIMPGVVENGVLSEALAFCEKKRAFLVMDPPFNASTDSGSDLPIYDVKTATGKVSSQIIPLSTNGALYFPYLKSTDPVSNNLMEIPPSGFVAGIYSRTDQNRGVWKAPAGLETNILNATGVTDRGQMNDQQQGKLNQVAVNCIRSFPGNGTVVFGARTLVGNDDNPTFQQWRYVPVRRMALFIEQTLFNNLKWVIFEPNDEPLWIAIRTSIERFMLSLYRQGAFQGSSPSQAFQVKCDNTTTTQDDIDNGIVNIIVAFAPLKPAEFVIVKIAQLAGQSQA